MNEQPAVAEEDENPNRHGRQSIFGTIYLKIAHFSIVLVHSIIFLAKQKSTEPKKYDSSNRSEL